MKKLYCIFLSFIILFNFSGFVYADDIDENFVNDDLKNIIDVSSENIGDEIKLNSKIAIAYDRKSKMIIWGKNENLRTAMASTTKIMTAIVAVENSNLNDKVIISGKAAGTGGSRLGLKKNDKIIMKDLLYGLMLRSGNDAAVAIAEHVGGSISNFANLMNNKAKELGLENTHFVTPHGLDDPDHYTTGLELAKIADYCLDNKIISNIVSTKFYTISINGVPKNLTNTNELLGNLNGVNGVKTGFTNNAGRCLVTSVNRADFNIITVILQADTKKIRTQDSIKLIEFVYKNYEVINIKKIIDEKFYEWCNMNKNRIIIKKAKNEDFNLDFSKLKSDFCVIRKKDIDNIEIDINSIFEFEAPLEKNKVIGNLKVFVKDDIICLQDIYISNEIKRKNIKDYFLECLKVY